MNRSLLNSVIRGAEALAARDGVGARPDAELLRRFTADRDAAAFAVLVRRHGPLVWGVCRNLLPADADAEDAFQATFLALVRSAATVRNTEALGGWLHGVAYRVSMRARRAAARRKQRELAAAVPDRDTPVADAAWDELQAAVHEEVCRLPEKLRLPFVLCGLQGRPQKEAAKQLGWKIGTISARLTLARKRLLHRLARRGIPAAMAAGAAVLGVTSGKASVPSKLTAKVLAAAAQPDAVSHVILTLARGATQMYLTRTKILIASILMAGVLTTGIGTHALSTAEAQSPPADPNQETLKLYVDFLRTNPASQDRWEYKFIPLDKPPTATEMKTILSTADHEGWEYCGSQELASEKRGGGTSANLVFKKPRMEKGLANNRASAAAALLGLARNQEQKAKDEAAAVRSLELAQRKQAEAAEKRAKDDAAKFALELSRFHQAEAAEKQALLAERTARDWALSRTKANQTDAANALAQEKDRVKVLEQQIQKLRMEQEYVVKQLQDLKVAATAKAADSADKVEIATIRLKYVSAAEVKQALSKMLKLSHESQLSVDTRTNSIVVAGLPAFIADVKKLVAELDVAGKPK